ncbi:MAG TPA: hypothetical protein VFC63_09445 [Blastocatellia bacterium]|nr:hypothetical protein [Blastocatellia bacterium]
MIYRAGDCPICDGAGDLFFLRSVRTDQIFFGCPECGCGWPKPSVDTDDLFDPKEVCAPEGYSLASKSEIDAAGLTHLIESEFSEEDLKFDGSHGFVPPYRDPQRYDGKTIVVTYAGRRGENEREWVTMVGLMKFEDGKLWIDRGQVRKRFEIIDEWIQRIKPQFKDARGVGKECEYQMSLALNAFPNHNAPPELMEFAD